MEPAHKVEQAAVSQVKNNVIDKTFLIKIDEHENVPVYASITCFLIASLYKPLMRKQMIQEALKAFRRRDPNDCNGQKLRVLHGNQIRDYHFLWVVQDEEAISFMFPEDF